MTTNTAPILTPILGEASARALPPLAASMTFRNWARTLFWTWAAVTFCLLICYPFDKWGLRWFNDAAARLVEHRMFKNPTELPMRVFGLPHFIIALMFVMSSRRMKETVSKLQFAALLALGTGFCVVFYKLGAHENPFLMFLFYFYFLIHGFRDDAYFYKAYGDMPKEGAVTHQRVLAVMQCLAIGLIISLIWPTYAQMSMSNYKLQHPILQNFFPATWPFVAKLASTFVPMLMIALVALRRIARVYPDGLSGLWRLHRPILTIQLASLGIVLFALVGGPWTFNIVVLMHFVGWYLFAVHLLGKRPPTEPRASASGFPQESTEPAPLRSRLGNIWQWMRTTRTGFMTLHLGMAALVVVLIGIDVYGYGKESWLDVIVGSKNFYYWTVMHVTLSFLPR